MQDVCKMHNPNSVVRTYCSLIFRRADIACRLGNNSGLFRAKKKHQMPCKKKIRSNKKDVIFDLMTDLG